MKKFSFVLFIGVLLLTVGGCKKVIKRVFDGLSFNVPEIVVAIPYFPVPPGTPVPASEISVGSYSQQFNLDSAVKANTGGTFGAADVKSVKVEKIVMTVIEGANANNNLSNFESARFTLASDVRTEPVNVATIEFPNTETVTTTFTAPENSPELLPYLQGSNIIYQNYGKLRRYTTQPMTLSVKVTLNVR